MEECRRNCSKISGCCPFYEIHTFHGVSHPRPPILGGTWKKGKAEKICYFKGDPKFKAGGGCDPLGHHAFVKYPILFMIIYMKVKLGLVLWFLRMEKVLKCCVNLVLWLSTYMIFLLGIPLSVEVIPAR